MYSEQLAELDRGALRRLLEDLEQEGVSLRDKYAELCLEMINHPDDWTGGWDRNHVTIAAERDAGLARVKMQLARVNRALEDKRVAAAELKAARKAVRK